MINRFLRQGQGVEQWATSISILTSAIIKLSAQACMQPIYRSIANATFDAATPDGALPCGLVHFDNGFSSSTPNIDVAFACAPTPGISTQ
jgi:hypothetical protein